MPMDLGLHGLGRREGSCAVSPGAVIFLNKALGIRKGTHGFLVAAVQSDFMTPGGTAQKDGHAMI